MTGFQPVIPFPKEALIMWRSFRVLVCALAFCLSVYFTTVDLAASQQKADAIVGRWDLTVMGTDAPYTSWMEVTQNGGRHTGRFVGRFGSARPIKQIVFKDGNLSFSLPPQYEQMKVDLIFKGKLIGGKLEGTT